MKPYYDHAGITIFNADCRDVLPTLGPVDLVLTDPPYGINLGKRSGGNRSKVAAASNNYAIAGDDEPFDPHHLLRFNRLVLFGANHYADQLPPSSSWIVWDKRAGGTSDDSSDCELIWTNLGGPARLYTHLWRGMIKGSQQSERRVHPSEKPVAIMLWILIWAAMPGNLILDPYMGSGPVLLAAKMLKLRAIGIELDERYCEIAARRLSQEVFDLST